MYHIFMNEKYISVLTEQVESEIHSHQLLQIFVADEGDLSLTINGQHVSGSCIVIDSNVLHHVRKNDNVGFLMFIEPTCSIAKQFKRKFTKYGFSVFQGSKLLSCLNDFKKSPTQRAYLQFIRNLFFLSDINLNQQTAYDQRVKQVIHWMEFSDCSEYSVKPIANKLAISPSRLEHLFKEQTGMPLKSYLTMHRLINAYQLLFGGASITEAALQSGFDSSAHFAMLNKKLTGVTASSILKDSEFLKVCFLNL